AGLSGWLWPRRRGWCRRQACGGWRRHSAISPPSRRASLPSRSRPFGRHVAAGQYRRATPLHLAPPHQPAELGAVRRVGHLGRNQPAVLRGGHPSHADLLLPTTRSVRKRLDLLRPVEPAVIERAIEVALQAPTGSNSQGWHFVVVTDAEKRAGLAALYRRAFQAYVSQQVPGRAQL